MDNPLTPVLPANAAALRAEGPVGAMLRLQQMPLRAKVMVGLGAAGLVAIAVALLLWSQQANYAPLYTGLAEKDAGPVLGQLEQMGVPFQLSPGGSIMVPADQVRMLKIKLRQSGLPRDATLGNELLETSQFGQSPAKERNTLNRALEGELARSIMALEPVQTARVHLSIPPTTAFFHDQPKPSASVFLTLRAGRTLDRGQVAGIVSQVAAAVAGMNPKDVRITDQSGIALNDADDGTGLDRQQLEFVRQVETGLQRRVVDILEPTVGRDNLRAVVTAEIDFNQVESTTEQFKPNQNPADAALRSVRDSESGGPGSLQPTGVPGAASNQPGAAAGVAAAAASGATLQAAQAGTAGAASRRERQAQYEIDRTVAVRRNATGTIRKVSAAVNINHRSFTDAKGKTTTTPLSPEELQKIEALVGQAIGFTKDRGDTIQVVNLPFRVEPATKPEDVPFWRQQWLTDLVRAGAVPAALIAVAAMLVFAVVRPAMQRVQAPEAPAPTPAPGAALDEVIGEPALPAAAEIPALEMAPTNQQLETARALARQNPAAVASILRGWVNGAEA